MFNFVPGINKWRVANSELELYFNLFKPVQNFHLK